MEEATQAAVFVFARTRSGRVRVSNVAVISLSPSLAYGLYGSGWAEQNSSCVSILQCEPMWDVFILEALLRDFQSLDVANRIRYRGAPLEG